MLYYLLRGKKRFLNEALNIYQELSSDTEIEDEIFEMAAIKSIGILLQMGQYKKILSTLKNLILRFPQNIHYKILLGQEYVKTKKDELAIDIFEQIVDEKDAFAMGHLSKTYAIVFLKPSNIKKHLKFLYFTLG